MVSINDVAKHAGVSNATVSRVLSGYEHVSEKTRSLVLQAVNELNYQPDKTARRLRSQSTSQVIGLIVSDIQNPHFSAMVRGVEDFAYQHNMNIILCNTDEQPEREEFYLHLMQSERAAGVLINPISPNAYQILTHLQSMNISVVLLDNQINGFESDSIGVTDWQGAYDMTSHIIAMGNKRIGIIAGDPVQVTGVQRLQGYKDALKDNGLNEEESLIEISKYTIDGGYEATLNILQQSKPDALFTCTNSLTIGALKALKEYNLNIPNNICLATFDDLPYAEFFHSPLTSVAQPSYQIGAEAGRLIHERLKSPETPYKNIELPCELIIRQSCGEKLRT